eukprot:m.65560 g.65560  ORF g.65560 m.65560 type:complete len:244 (-) comp13546_c0_seq1:60-791(-)
MDGPLRTWDDALEQENLSIALRESERAHAANILSPTGDTINEPHCACVRVDCIWCNYSVKICNRRDHLFTCQSVPLDCIHGCGAVLPKREHVHHWRHCRANLEKCGFCQDVWLPPHKLTKHVQLHLSTGAHRSLENQPFYCPLLTQGCMFSSTDRAALTRHMANCGLWSIYCQGCQKTHLRRDYSEHVLACSQPSRRFQTCMSRQMDALHLRVEQQQREQEEQQQYEESQLTRAETESRDNTE